MLKNSTETLSKVSVIMVTFGHEKYIKEAIEGVLMQECNFELELIIADDCSPDATQFIVKQISGSHPKGHWIKYTRHAKNLGMMPNFIWALEQSTGKYIALCEGDDYWTDPSKLQKQVDFLEDNLNYALITTNVIVSEKDTKHLLHSDKSDYNFNFHEQIDENKCATCSVLVRNNNLKDLIKIYPTVPIGDMIVWAIAMRDNLLGRYSNQTTAVYRVHDGGVFSSISKLSQSEKIIETYELMIGSKIFNKLQNSWIIDRTNYWRYSIIRNQRPKNSFNLLLKILFSTKSFNSFSTLLKSTYCYLFG